MMDRALLGTAFTLYDDRLMPSRLCLVLPDGNTSITIAMVDDDEIGVLVNDETNESDPECVWSQKLEEPLDAEVLEEVLEP